MFWQRQNFLLSYLMALSVGAAGVWTRDLPLSRTGALSTEPPRLRSISHQFLLYWNTLCLHHATPNTSSSFLYKEKEQGTACKKWDNLGSTRHAKGMLIAPSTWWYVIVLTDIRFRSLLKSKMANNSYISWNEERNNYNHGFVNVITQGIDKNTFSTRHTEIRSLCQTLTYKQFTLNWRRFQSSIEGVLRCTFVKAFRIVKKWPCQELFSDNLAHARCSKYI